MNLALLGLKHLGEFNGLLVVLWVFLDELFHHFFLLDLFDHFLSLEFLEFGDLVVLQHTGDKWGNFPGHVWLVGVLGNGPLFIEKRIVDGWVVDGLSEDGFKGFRSHLDFMNLLSKNGTENLWGHHGHIHIHDVLVLEESLVLSGENLVSEDGLEHFWDFDDVLVLVNGVVNLRGVENFLIVLEESFVHGCGDTSVSQNFLEDDVLKDGILGGLGVEDVHSVVVVVVQSLESVGEVHSFNWDNLLFDRLVVSNNELSGNWVNHQCLLKNLSRWQHLDVSNSLEVLLVDIHVVHHLFQKISVVGSSGGGGVWERVHVEGFVHAHGDGPLIVVTVSVWHVVSGGVIVVLSFGGEWNHFRDDLELWDDVFHIEDWVSEVHLELWNHPELLEKRRFDILHEYTG